MRFGKLLMALPLLAAVASPVIAQDVEYVSGTGNADVWYANDEDPPYADEDASYADDEVYYADEEDGVIGIAGRISDPMMQDGIAAVVEQTAGAMMNLPVGPFAQAIERARPGTVDRRIRQDATIADIAGRDARYLPQELGERSREAMGAMSGFARAMAVMMPEFERMGREMEESLRAARAQARLNR